MELGRSFYDSELGIKLTLRATQADGDSISRTFSFTVIGKVQHLVNAASPGDTVTVPAGAYIDGIIIDKELTLQGAGANQTVIDGNRVNIPLLITNNAVVVVRDLTLRNGRSGLRNDGAATLIRCAVRNNEVWESGGGIWNGRAGSLLLQSRTVSSNRCYGAEGGGIHNATRLTAHHCTLTQNRAPSGGGIVNVGVAETGNCILAGNKADKQNTPDFRL